MAGRSQTSDDFDSPWKEALQAYLPFFLAFFFPDIHADIDWSRGYEALDKEFQQIARRGPRSSNITSSVIAQLESRAKDSERRC